MCLLIHNKQQIKTKHIKGVLIKIIFATTNCNKKCQKYTSVNLIVKRGSDGVCKIDTFRDFNYMYDCQSNILCK